MVRHLIDKIKGKIKRGITKGIFLASAGILFSGCPLPYPNYTTEQPTTEATAEPTAEPTPTPIDNDYFDFSGRLEDNENDGIGREGIVRVYNQTDDSLIGTYHVNGDFNFTLDKLNSQLPNGVKVKARLGSESSPTSYVRTINLPQGDQSNVLVRAVPYPDFCTPEEFKQQVIDTNPTYSKWDLDEFQKIKIFRYNGTDAFSDDQISISKDKIKNSADIEKFVEGKELDDYIEVVDGSPNSENYFEEGCILVVPDDSISGGVAVAHTLRENRKIKAGRIDINPCSIGINSPVLTHEFGHLLTSYWGHSKLPDEITIMNQYNYTEDVLPLGADSKQAKLINENTYPAGENVDKILGIE